MAYTYSKIATYTVGSGGLQSISFLNIPQTYTDLVLRFSGRNSRSNDNLQEFTMGVNNNTSTQYVFKYLRGSGSAAISNNYPAESGFHQLGQPGDTATASTFSNYEIYFPNYTSSNYKSVSIDGVTENNATAAYSYLQAGLITNTAPITSIYISAPSYLIMQYSTFHLYGIKAEL